MECTWPTLVLFFSILEILKTMNITASNILKYNNTTNDPNFPVNTQSIQRVLEEKESTNNDKEQDGLHFFLNDPIMVLADPGSVQESDLVYDQKTLQELLEDIQNKGAVSKDIGSIIEKNHEGIYKTLEHNRNTVTEVLGNILIQQDIQTSIANHDKTQSSASVLMRKTLVDALNEAAMNVNMRSLRKHVQPFQDGTGLWSTKKRQKNSYKSSPLHKRRSAEDVMGDTLMHHDNRRTVKKDIEPLQDYRNKSAPTLDDEILDQNLEEDDEANLYERNFEGHSAEDEEPIEEGPKIKGSEENIQNFQLDSEEHILFGNMENEIGNMRDSYYIHSPLGHRRARSQLLRRRKLHSQSRQSHLAHVRKTRE